MSATTSESVIYSEEYTTDILMGIVSALESVYDKPAEELPTIAEYVNIDALITVLNEDPKNTTSVSFEYEQHLVTVTKDTIEVKAA